MSCEFVFFFCKGNSLTMHSMEKKENMTGRITKTTRKTYTEFLYKTHSFYNSFLNLVPSENRKKMHERDSRIQHLSAALPCRMQNIHFCSYSCSTKLNNILSLAEEKHIWGEKKISLPMHLTSTINSCEATKKICP